MQELEERLRDSLRQRANDVVPTPALWREVQRRTSRRRWLPSRQWVTASTAVAVTAVAVLIALPNLPELQNLTPDSGVPGAGGDDSSMDTADDDAGMMSREEADSAPESTDDESTGDQDAGSPEASVGSELPGGDAAADGPEAGDALVSVAGRDLVLHHPDGDRIIATTNERDRVFVTTATRPGSDAEDITLVVLTAADGAMHLRWLRVVDGAVVQELTAFDAGDVVSPDAEHVAGPVWTPDGESVVWIEEAGRQVTLRTLGWDNSPVNPGDGQDPVSFDLDLDAARLEVESVLADADGDVLLVLVPGVEADRTSPRHEVRLNRRVDGVYEPESGVQRRDGS